jgi:hypothetical protein
MKDVVDVAECIDGKIDELEQLKTALEAMPDLVAASSAEYEKKLAKTIIQLKNGVSFKLEGVEVSKPLTSITEKIARGLCWLAAMEAQANELKYKILNKKIDIVEAQLNGYQSINRHLSEK